MSEVNFLVKKGLTVPKGSASTPAIIFDAADPDTGIYSPGANELSISTGGTERLRFGSTGQLASVSLGSASAPAFSFTGDPNTGIYSPGADQVAVATNGTGRLFVDASGNVGIGNTTGLGGTLGVSGNISLSGSGTGTRYLGLLSETSTYAGSFLLQAGGGSSSFGGAITMYGNSHATYPGSVYIGTSTSSGGSIIFGTDNATDPSGERVRIDSSGRVGIGTSSPSTFGKLAVVVSGSGSKNGIGISNGGFNGSAGSPSEIPLIEGFSNSGTLPTGLYALNSFSSYTDHWLAFKTTNRTGTTATRLTIDAEGNVGIGTTSPSEALDVSGNVTISGSISKGSGSFKITHPLETKKDTHYLVHSFIEGPRADLIYRGTAKLTNGKAVINLDLESNMTAGTFEALCTNVSCFTSNETDWTPVKGSVSKNKLTIVAQDTASSATVSWLVVGERKDPHMLEANWTDENGRIIVEPEKEEA
jgi:hypothetical protein